MMMRASSSVGPSREAIFEDESHQNEASFWQQLKATTVRNLYRKKRNKKQTFREIFTPLYYLALIIVMKYAIPNPTYPAILSPLGTSSLFNFPDDRRFNRTVIGVAPSDEPFKNLVKSALDSPILKNNTIDLIFFDNETSLSDAYEESIQGTRFYGLIFQSSDDGRLSYKIRTSEANLPAATDRNTDGAICRPTEDEGKTSDPPGDIRRCPPSNYYFNGFLTLQAAIDFTWISIQSPTGFSFPEEILLQLAPKEALLGGTITVLRSIIPLYLVIALSQFVPPMLIVVVEEKEKKIKESMRMVGLRGSVFWLSWFFVYAIMVVIVALLGTIIMHFVVIGNSNFLVLFILILEFGLSMIMFAFIMTTLFSKAKVAAGVGGLVSIMAACFFYVQVFAKGLPSYAFWLMSLLSQPAFAMAIDRMMYFDSANLDIDLWDDSEGLPIAGAMIMILIDIFLYGMLAAWLDNILPTEYGTRRPPWFCFQPSYWRRQNVYLSSESSVSRTASPVDDNFIGEDIEDIPEQLVNTEALVICNIKKTFKVSKGKTVEAVKGINLKIYPNEITAILGHNGAGKTTLFNMLTGMTSPTSGTASICGYDIKDQNQMEEIRKMTGICPQHDILFDELTTKEHLQFFARIRGVKESKIESAVKDIIKDVDLVEKTDVVAKKLSGGQKRKLSVGIALIGDPKIIFLDEPTAGVDPYSRRHMWNLLKEKKEGKVILLTTHFMDEADLLADRKAIISHGSLRCYGSSLFLKNRFGLGYTLTMVLKPDARLEGITGMIQSHIPTAKKARLFGRELSFVLPRDDVSNFPRLFEDIEDQIKNGQDIDSYGTSMPTLEEVFLRLGDEEEASQQHHQQNQDSQDQIKDNSNQGYEFETVATQKNWQQTYKALVKIRLLDKFRNPASVIVQVVLPIVYSVIALMLQSFQEDSAAIDEVLNISSSFLYPNGPEPFYGYQNLSSEESSLINFQANMEQSLQYIQPDVSYAGLVNYSSAAYFSFANSIRNGLPLNLTLIVDERFSHVLPMALNDLSNSMAGIVGLDEKIRLTSQPFKAANPAAGFDGLQFTGSMFLGFTYVIMIIGLALELIQDREIRAKNQLRVNGLGFYVYFASFYSVLLPMMFILCFALMILAQIFSLESVILGPAFAVFSLLYIIYPFPGIFFASTVSYAFDTVESGQFLFGTSTFFGFIPYIIVFILEAVQAGGSSNAARITHIICSFISPCYIPFGIVMYIGFIYARCHFNGTCQSLTVSDYLATPEIYTLFLACVFHTIFWFLALKIVDVIKDGGKISSAFDCTKKKQQSGNLLTNELEDSYYNRDNDVMKEREDVNQYFYELGSQQAVAVKQIQKIYGDTSIVKASRKKKSKQAKIAVSSVSFSVPKGQVFGLLGPNGAGKTTTMKMIIAEEHPTRGRIKIGPYEIQSNDSKGFEYIGYCPQFDALWKKITVKEHLEAYAAIRGVPPAKIQPLVTQIMKGLRIEEHANKLSENCSGGTKRKLSYGMAMLGDPTVVLLDEPSSGMDPQSKRFVWDTILASFKGERGAILTTHSMEEADALCSRVGIMVKGELRCLGSTQHLKNKYGGGYILDLKSKGNSLDTWNGIHQAILETFGGSSYAKIDEAFADRRTYSVQQSAVKSLGQVFAALENIKTSFNIEEYSFGQTTLEQVFIKFAKDQELEEEDLEA